MVDRDGSLIENKNFFNVYSYKDLLLFEFRYWFDSTYNNKRLKEEFRYSYFVYRQGEPHGINYDPHNPLQDNIRLSVDSLLEKRAFKNFGWEKILMLTPIKNTYAEAKRTLEEVYISNSNQKDVSTDTIRLYFTKDFNDFDYSFSEKLDSIKKMKLFKIRLQHSETHNEEHMIVFPKRETYFEMKEVPVKKQAEVMTHFHKYENSISKHK